MPGDIYDGAQSCERESGQQDARCSPLGKFHVHTGRPLGEMRLAQPGM